MYSGASHTNILHAVADLSHFVEVAGAGKVNFGVVLHCAWAIAILCTL